MGSQPSWPPFQATTDCSQGICSVYCQQWCYFIFPPPPFFDGDGGADSGPTLSPLVIALIALAAAALLLIGYYTIIYRYCRRWRRPDPGPPAVEEGAAGWHASPSSGLDETLINKISVCRYRRAEGLVGGTNCSVCLSEFREDESLRLLPKCGHAFHVLCIDTWLKSHPNCPLCRASIVWANPPIRQPAPPEPQGDQSIAEGERMDEVAVALQDSETSLGNPEAASKGPSHDAIQVRDEGVQLIRRSFSMDSDDTGSSTGGSINQGRGRSEALPL